MHSQRWEPKDFTHVAFRYHYLSEPSWSAPGIWQAELLVDGTSLWAVDLFSGAAHYVTNQEVSLAAVPAGFRQLTFRLVYNGTDPYTGPLPTFLIDDVRFLKRTSSLETILWLFLWGVATVVKDAADAQAAIASLLRITDAYGVDLERLGADYGIKKPITLGLSDAQYRNLIRQCIVEPKKTLLAIKDLIRTLTGANPVSMTELPPVGSAPPELVIVLDGGFLTPDIADLVDFWFYG